ncbi:deoxyribose-phosphate aldolase [Hutsoniella sourekii]|uniref:deoxyribose-phosphate aldolase n=1 Tax=Hutsoniella sourekii TaxID=87650 RepID=UPI00048754DA|nr:deoxyribose-phosphate aldolase [Hutsoniella sourekii]
MNLAKYIDHTLLKADAKKEEIIKLCQEAKDYDFMSVCIQPCWVTLAKQELSDSDVKVCTVIGFPLGANASLTKANEAKLAEAEGADEVDMVINIGLAKDGDWQGVQEDIQAVVDAVSDDTLVKVIIETCLLTDDEKVKACQASVKAGADYVKTSTGFSTGGATIEDIRLMAETVGEDYGVKASGGVSNREEALAMIEAGATRIGASKGIAIVSQN